MGGDAPGQPEEPGVPVDDRADVERDLRVGRQVVVERAQHELRVERVGRLGDAPLGDLVPRDDAALDLGTPALAGAQAGEQQVQRERRVAGETDLDGVLRAEVAGRDVDLHGADGPGRRVELGPRVAAAHDQERVAAREEVGGRGRPEVAHDPAVVRQALVEERLAQQRRRDPRAEPLGDGLHLLGGTGRPLPDQQRDPLAGVEELDGPVQRGVVGDDPRTRPRRGRRHDAVGVRRVLREVRLLHVVRHDHARGARGGERGADGVVEHERQLLGGVHGLDVLAAHVLEQRREVDLLEVAAAERGGHDLPDDRDDGLAVELGVVEPGQEVDRPGALGREADADPAAVLRVPGRHERGHLLVPRGHELDGPRRTVERREERVDPVAGEAEHALDPPLREPCHDPVRHRRHVDPSRGGLVGPRCVRDVS